MRLHERPSAVLGTCARETHAAAAPAMAPAIALPLHGSPAAETMALRITHAESDIDGGTFKGIASAFGVLIDHYVPTRIMPGAFAETIVRDRDRIKIIWQHDSWSPIGVPVVLRESGAGLEVEGRISGTTQGKDSLILLRDKVITELSIGFDPLEWSMTDEDGVAVRVITKLRLWEVSLVTWGANSGSKIRDVNALGATPAPAAIFAAALTLDAIDDAALRGVRRIEIERHYAAMGRKAPWQRDQASLAAQLEPLLSMPTPLSDAHRAEAHALLTSLGELLGTNEPAAVVPHPDAARIDSAVAGLEALAQQINITRG